MPTPNKMWRLDISNKATSIYGTYGTYGLAPNIDPEISVKGHTNANTLKQRLYMIAIDKQQRSSRKNPGMLPKLHFF